MFLQDFSYQLPPQLIAAKPSFPRDHCRLMVLDRSQKSIEHLHFYDLEQLLHPGDVLVFNNSKVIPARINFYHHHKKIELLLTRRLHERQWLTIGKPGKILQEGTCFEINPDLFVKIEKILPDGQRLVTFSLQSNRYENIDTALEYIGLPPFPPYIKNSSARFEDYQTIYAQIKGSVAAPTAGLHFTSRLLHKLIAKGVQLEFVTLHVGPGTFLPIKTRQVEKHRMHSEFFTLDPATAKRLNTAKAKNKRLIAVGTTSVRVLESCFNPQKGFISQSGETRIFIYPGYQWKCVDGLITNFHLPESTLLALTCSFTEREFVLKAYKEAIRKHYRFYSFGDAMILL